MKIRSKTRQPGRKHGCGDALGARTFDEGALQLITRAVQGKLRLCQNLCYASLVAACMDGQRNVSVSHVNAALVQPHWRSHDALLKQQALRRGGP